MVSFVRVKMIFLPPAFCYYKSYLNHFAGRVRNFTNFLAKFHENLSVELAYDQRRSCVMRLTSIWYDFCEIYRSEDRLINNENNRNKVTIQ